MKNRAYYEQSIPSAALEWARNEVKDIIRMNGARIGSFDDLACICVLRGVIVAATAPELAAVMAECRAIDAASTLPEPR